MIAILLVAASAVAATLCFVLLYLYARERSAVKALRVELAQAEEQNSQDQDALRQRQQLDLLKDEFIATVSHELRTPLTSIRGALGLLSAGLMGKMDDKAQNLLRIASTNTDRLVRLINDILDLERMDSGQAPLQIERCSLAELVRAAADTMASMAEAAKVQVEIVDLPAEANDQPYFDGDPDRMQQVLCNLLSNAIKFSPVGSAIRIVSEVDPDNLSLRIEDHGRGIPADKLEAIFARFSQVEATDSRQKGGTGLGLAICRSILSQHGGAIWAERNDKDGSDRVGTTFVLRVPRVRGVTEAVVQPVSARGAVLLVDDDAGVRQVMAEQLRRHGYDILETDRGEQALHIAEKQHVEAILLDLYMPGLSGWETLERLKRNPSTANIPVVVLSVLSPLSKKAEATQVMESAHGWIQKPFNESLLLAELGRVLHRGSGPGRILLVEDDQVMADVVLGGFQDRTVEKQRITVEHVRSMSAAKTACKEQPPDIMILDVSLPDGDGFALVQWLREQPALRRLPLVVYSGREVNADEMEKLRLGPTQFLTKAQVQPAHVEELVMAMVRQLRHPTLEAQTA